MMFRHMPLSPAADAHAPLRHDTAADAAIDAAEMFRCRAAAYYVAAPLITLDDAALLLF